MKKIFLWVVIIILYWGLYVCMHRFEDINKHIVILEGRCDTLQLKYNWMINNIRYIDSITNNNNETAKMILKIIQEKK